MANESLVFDILARDGASPSLKKVGDAALEASGGLKDLSAKLKDINGRTAAARVKLDGDKEAQHELDTLDVKLIRLGKAVANPNIKLDGVARARADISGLDLALDRLSAKSASPDVSGGGRGGLFTRLASMFSSGGSNGSGPASSAASGILSTPVLGPSALAAGIVGGAALLPGVAGLGLGGAAALGGIGLAALIGTQAAATIKLDQAQVKAAKSGPQLAAANKQLAADMKASSPFIAITADIKQLLVPLQAAVTPFAKFLDPVIKNFGAGLAKLGPVMSQVFDASIPFVKVFAGLMLQMGKSLLPAVSYALNQMVSSGALQEMTQGMVILIKGLAGFVTALGPGMKSSAMIFADVMVIAAKTLRGLGLGITWTANTLEDFFHRWRTQFDRLTTTLDAWRHNFSAAFIRVNTDLNNWRHNTAVIFDGARHDIAAVWDKIWNNTLGRVQRGISDTIGWFKGLPGRAVGALFGLGHSLSKFAHDAIGEMWTGFKNTFSSVITWFTGLPKRIMSALGLHSPPGWAIQAGRDIMKGLHIGLGHGLGQLTSFTTGIGAQVAAGLAGGFPGGGSSGPGAAAAQAYARRTLGAYGWGQSQMAPLTALWNQESGWRWNALNQSSGAYGIPQSLPAGKMAAAGSDWRTNPATQIRWGLGYIRSVYGSPAAAEAHEQRFNWYGKGLDAVISRPTLIGVGESGPEHVMVTPGARGGGNSYTIQVLADASADGGQIGAKIVDRIRQFERRSGHGWRK